MATFSPIFPSKMLSLFKTVSASAAWPKASCIKVPVSFGSIMTVNFPPTGDLASRSSIASLAVFSLNPEAFSVLLISKPPIPPTELTAL